MNDTSCYVRILFGSKDEVIGEVLNLSKVSIDPCEFELERISKAVMQLRVRRIYADHTYALYRDKDKELEESERPYDKRTKLYKEVERLRKDWSLNSAMFKESKLYLASLVEDLFPTELEEETDEIKS